ncbi:acetyl-CoA C-acyltransferase [Alicyclobacillus fodiniaquatilis]|uniref:acetyl-CoA C-acyltransferase n=1 Tax=Alicyclobacillus fodiniaquatilis TaxID=1661150 RepID=A0ABW4JAX8_9BACL
MKEAVIVAAARTPIGKAARGSLRHSRPDDLGAIVIQELLKRVTGVDKTAIEDVVVGCAMPEAEQGMNVGRIIALRAGLPTSVAGMTINRFCSSGLQSIAIAAQQIMTGMADVIVAGGVESMSMVPMTGYHFAPNPTLVDQLPETYMSMGHTAERVAKRFGITREEQDRFALRSHQLAAAAIDAGKFQAEIVPVPVRDVTVSDDGRVVEQTSIFDKDEGFRRDTSLERLAQLRPAFQLGGTVTAGNSSQTSDGAAFVLMMSAERAQAYGLTPLAAFRSFAVAGVDPDIMGVGPVAAVPKALQIAGLSLADIGRIELNEAFAAQAIQVIRGLEMEEAKVNVNGGAIALGHPLGCTGARLTVSLLHEQKRTRSRFGLVTMCIGGGMGAAGVFECFV